MSLNSARLGLGVAALVAAAGIAFYVVKSDAAKIHPAGQGKNPTGEAYKGFPTPVPADHAPNWEKPFYEEEDLWKYDLFTPVETTWNPTSGLYVPKGTVIAPPTPFGLKLLSLKHPQYRYRFSVLAESESHKPEDSIIVLQDSESGMPVRGKIGAIIDRPGGKIQILGYENKPVKRPDGSSVRDTVVKVKDFTLNKEIEIRREPTVFAEKTDIVFALEGSDAPVWTGHAVDDKFENEAGSYVIKGIDFETQSVTVAKTWTEEKKHTVKTESADLRPEVSKKPTPPVSTTKPNEAKSK